MRVKNDDALPFLRSFGFHMEEHTQEGFIRYNKALGNMLITVANGQFENKIRVSLLQDKDGHIRTSYRDILEYSELLVSMQEAGLFNEEAGGSSYTMEENLDEMENPLIGFPKKPEGFMMQ